ncbi:hypothetical protein GCM10025783_21840 [Amnibacterium soli]|uniref:Phospholipase/carboxylesterase/thioesterase domain-containing protein n=1 Tax=Amnibacterium soli TaxID=1282736 RepID=A0ABP8Z7W7_9MICO
MTDASIPLHAVAMRPIGRLEGRRLLVLLHGYGADEQDLLAVGEAVRGDDDAVVSLRGPVPVGAGAGWFDGPREAVLAGAGLEAAATAVLATLNALAAAAGEPAAVRLLGFSQGGALALALLHAAPQRFDRVAVLAGFLPATLPAPPPGAAVLWARGDADAVIPPEAVARTAAALEGRSATSISVHPGLGHGIDEAELAEVAAFLR